MLQACPVRDPLSFSHLVTATYCTCVQLTLTVKLDDTSLQNLRYRWSFTDAYASASGLQLDITNTEAGVDKQSVTILSKALPRSGEVGVQCTVTPQSGGSALALTTVRMKKPPSCGMPEKGCINNPQ